MRRRTVLVAGGLVVAGVALGAVLTATFLGTRPRTDGGGRAGAELALSPAGAELVSLLRRGEEATYHARYRGVSSKEEAGALTILLWQRPPLARQDLLVSVSGRTVRTAGFLFEERAVACIRPAGGAWSCSRRPGLRSQGPDALIREITSQVEAGPIRARDATVSGAAVRCFTLPLSGGSGEVCLTESGIPARISAGPSRFELVELVETFPDDVFTPPASPAAG